MSEVESDGDPTDDESAIVEAMRFVPAVVLPDEHVSWLFENATAIPLREEPSDESVRTALRSLMAAGLVTVFADPESDGVSVLVPMPPLLWARELMEESTTTTTLTLSIGEHRKVYAIYRTDAGEMLLEEVLEGGYRSYVSYSPEELVIHVDGLRVEDEGDGPGEGELSLPMVLRPPFDVAADEEGQRLLDALDLVLSLMRTDRSTGEVSELTLAEGVGVGRVQLVSDPPQPAASETIVVSRLDWSGETVRAFVER